jgi:biopolymer transport protein ExbD
MNGIFGKSRRTHHSSLAELNITPLLDLVFVLLVIFIITTPQLTNSLQINLPSGKPPTPKPDAPKPKIHRIKVDEKGQAFLDGAAFGSAELKQALARLKADDPALVAVVEGADETDYQSMVNVLDILQQLDITKIGLATEQAGAQ